MKLTVFAKSRTNKDGKKFLNFISRLTRKDGTEIPVQVRFKSFEPTKFPCNIIVEKENCNLGERKYIDESTGEQKTGYTLWVSEWEDGEPYEDHSLDEFLTD